MPPEASWHRRVLLGVGGPVAALVLLVAFWDFMVWYYAIPRYVMPSPGEVYDHAREDWSALWKGMRTTFVELLLRCAHTDGEVHPSARSNRFLPI